jgi:hypothetical protein
LYAVLLLNTNRGQAVVSVRLDETVQITLNASGNGTASRGPLSAREVWHPQWISVKANPTPVNEAICKIYAGDTATDDNFRDGTFSGSSGDVTDAVNGEDIKCGHKIFAVWTGGDASVKATLNITGTKEV